MILKDTKYYIWYYLCSKFTILPETYLEERFLQTFQILTYHWAFLPSTQAILEVYEINVKSLLPKRKKRETTIVISFRKVILRSCWFISKTMSNYLNWNCRIGASDDSKYWTRSVELESRCAKRWLSIDSTFILLNIKMVEWISNKFQGLI